MAASGQRDHLVEIQQRTTVASPGYPVETWARLGTAYMQRVDKTADERFIAAQQSAYQLTAWQMPYRANMDPELVDVPATRRLVYAGRTYDIQSASRLDRMTLELLTLAGSAVA